MSHSPESHSHHEPAEPDRIPIPDPGENFMVVRKEGDSWITTHQGPNGDFYTIKNASTPEANMTLYNEKKRNEKLKNAEANGLYRFNTHGMPIRPAASGGDFTAAVDADSTIVTPDQYDAGTPGGFISYGRSENGNNEMAAIDERSASIVLSYEARDKAIKEGKSVEEAQEIGAQVYRDQEGFKETSRVSPGPNLQPETTSINGTPEQPADGKERFRAAKWLIKTGREAVINFRVLKNVGPGKVIDYAIHKLDDALDQGFDTAKKATLKEAEKVLGEANDAVKQTVESYKTTKKSIEAIPGQLTYEYKVAIKELGDNMLKVSGMWQAYRERLKQEAARRTAVVRDYPATPGV